MNPVKTYKDEQMYSQPRKSSKHDELDSQSQRTSTKERENLECQILSYRGNDPLEPYYNYVIWLEKNSSDFVSILEDILVKFKDITYYKQDPRLIYILVKYISTQTNPVELYQLVHDQGLGTRCSMLYKYWAEEFDRRDDFKAADRIFQLGMSLRAQPEKDLIDAHIQFQLGIARRVLQGNISVLKQRTNLTTHTETTKLRSSQIHTHRYNTQFTDVSKREIKTNHGFQVGEDHVDGKENEKWYEKPLDIPREIGKVERLSSKNEFRCPVAIFEPPDPTKKPMYPKDLVYVNGSDIQLEEIRAQYFSKLRRECKQKSVQPSVEPMNLTKSAVVPMDSDRSSPVTHSTLKRTYSDTKLPQDQSWCLKTDFIPPVEKPQVIEFPSVTLQKSSHILNPDASIKDQSWYLRTDFIEPVKMGASEMMTMRMFPETHASRGNVEIGGVDKEKDEVFDLSNQCASAFHYSPTTSFTVNTKAAMNVIQKMWESPLAPRNTKVGNASEESDVFKMPVTRKSDYFRVAEDDSDKNNPSSVFPVLNSKNDVAFPIYCEEEGTNPQTDIYSRLSSRGSSRKVTAVENRLNVLEICDSRENQWNAVQTAPSIPPVKLPDVPRPFQDKENAPPGNEVLVDDHKLQEILMRDGNNENENELLDETCSTKAFAKLLPSSTPFSRPDRSRVSRKSSIFNGSYIEEDGNFCVSNQIKSSGVHLTNNLSTMNITKNPTNLSLILENSKEQGWSSSGGNAPKSLS